MEADACDVLCTTTDPEELNRLCACAVVDLGQVRETLAVDCAGSCTLNPALHAHLFSPYALFVHRTSLDLMGAVANAVFDIARNPNYVDHVLGWAPDIALHDPGSLGGVLGLDFHLTVAGPRLIEINTNPGGLLLNARLVDAVRSCAPATWVPWTSGAQARDASVAAWLQDARAQLGRMPQRIAIVDVAPREQFLYPEFELYAEAFRQQGVDSVICPPDALTFGPDGLEHADGQIDAVYNRLTDFALADPVSAPLHQAYLGRAIDVAPRLRWPRPITADQCARAILHGVDRNAAVILAPASAVWLWRLFRWSPGLFAATASTLYTRAPIFAKPVVKADPWKGHDPSDLRD